MQYEKGQCCDLMEFGPTKQDLKKFMKIQMNIFKNIKNIRLVEQELVLCIMYP